MNIGVSEVNITPAVGIELCGYGTRVQPSTAKHHDLYVRGLFLEQSPNKLLWLHADLIGLDQELVRQLGKTAAAELDLEDYQIVMSATHTHSGPGTQRLRG